MRRFLSLSLCVFGLGLAGCCPVNLDRSDKAAPVTEAPAASSKHEIVAGDAAVTWKINNALSQSAKLRPYAPNVQVFTTKESVTLQGQVPRRDTITDMVAVAEKYGEGRKIISYLKIGGPIAKGQKERERWE